jgi:hypothetical protein
LKIQQNHIRRIFLYPLQGFSSGSSFIADLPGILLLKESTEIIPDRRVIVDYQNANQAGRPPLSNTFLLHSPRSGKELAPGYSMFVRY